MFVFGQIKLMSVFYYLKLFNSFYFKLISNLKLLSEVVVKLVEVRKKCLVLEWEQPLVDQSYWWKRVTNFGDG